MSDDIPTLTVGGKIYRGWETLTISRAIDRMASHFNMTLNERWDPERVWEIQPYDTAVVRIDDDVVLTGYIDSFDASVTPEQHIVSMAGRSKTEDVIDCTPDLPGGQFNGYALDQIARAIAAPFGVSVVVETDVGAAFPDATIQRHETGFQFLERLARLRSVLMTDDEQGRLVLTRAGSAQSGCNLVLGFNIKSLRVSCDTSRRFSEYRVRVQNGVETKSRAGTVLKPIDAKSGPDTTKSVSAQRGTADDDAETCDPVQTQASTTTAGVAYDRNVPRYRPHTIIAESALTASGAQARALWEAHYAYGRSINVTVTLTGWRKYSDGKLWKINELVSVWAPQMQLDLELLIVGVTFGLDGRGGRLTTLRLGPVEGYTPEPGQVRVRKERGNGKGGKGTYSNLKPISNT